MSMPWRNMSMSPSAALNLSWISGYWFKNGTTKGCRTEFKKASGAATVIEPAGSVWSEVESSTACCAALIMTTLWSYTNWPACVMINVRVVRSNSFTESAFSRRVINLLNAEGVTPSCFAAAVKLPSFTTKINEARSGSRAMSFGLIISIQLD